MTCNKSYVGHSGRTIAIRYKEHIRYTLTNSPTSAYALHILNQCHYYGPPDNMLHLLKPCMKGNPMNCWESFYTQQLNHLNLLIDEQQPQEPNPLYALRPHIFYIIWLVHSSILFSNRYLKYFTWIYTAILPVYVHKHTHFGFLPSRIICHSITLCYRILHFNFYHLGHIFIYIIHFDQILTLCVFCCHCVILAHCTCRCYVVIQSVLSYARCFTH
jgi:hypothetical protein